MVVTKSRYTVCEIVTGPCPRDVPFIHRKDVVRAVLHSVQALHGDFGLACLLTGFRVIMYNPMTKVILFTVPRRFHYILCTSLPMVKSVRASPASETERSSFFKTMHVSGTRRSACQFILNYEKQKLCELVQKHGISAKVQKTISALKKYRKRLERKILKE